MKSLNVRGVDDEVMVEFKLAAAKSGKRLRDWVLDSLCEVVDQEVGNGRTDVERVRLRAAVVQAAGRSEQELSAMPDQPERSVRAQAGSGAVVRKVQNDRSSGAGKNCPNCGLPMKDWGRVWRCILCKKDIKK